MEQKYEEYYLKWLSGLESEIEFWKLYMEEKGGVNFPGYEMTVSPFRHFELEEDIPPESYGNSYRFLDVGSGPFSGCGKVTDKVNLDALSVDPLAVVYNALKEENGIDNGIKLETGFVELLAKKFEKNTFDMVHMSNSLDHSFDAVYGIFQLLYICKIGGKVILRHTENEAERTKYGGLHQWNLSLHNEEDTFLIWRNDKRYNIPELFREYADIELYPDQIEKGEGWKYNKVIMIKKKDVVLPQVDYYDQMFQYTYDYLLSYLLQNLKKRDRGPMSKNELACQKIIETYYAPEKFLRKIQDENIKSVDIYGMGEVGSVLYHLLEKYDIPIDQVIDRNKRTFRDKTAISFEEYIPHGGVTKVVVAICNDREAVLNMLSTKVDKKNIVSIDEFLGI